MEKVVDSEWFVGKDVKPEQNIGLNAVSDRKGKQVQVPNQTILIQVFESWGAADAHGHE